VAGHCLPQEHVHSSVVATIVASFDVVVNIIFYDVAIKNKNSINILFWHSAVLNSYCSSYWTRLDGAL
jgi:hypothetical protein